MRIRGKSGQATVELAVIIPIVLVVAIIVWQVMEYLVLCARFDRVTEDIIRVYAIESPTARSSSSLCTDLASRIEEMMDTSAHIRVRVAIDVDAANSIYDLLPTTVTYVCRLEFSPWPGTGRTIDIAGTSTGIIPMFTHTKKLVAGSFGFR